MSNMLPMLYETVFGILALFILTKILGKTQISQLTAFDFIAAIVLGELVGNALFDKKTGILDIGYVILLWGVILYIIEMVTQKFNKSRFLLEGKPSIVIHEGNIIYEELRKNKLDIDELQQLLRMKDIFSIQEVQYAVLESNGEISVLKKFAYQPPTKQDFNLKVTTPEIAMTLISDGEIIEDNIRETGVSEKWLHQEIQRQGFDTVRDVFYAEWFNNKLFALPYTKIREKDYKKK